MNHDDPILVVRSRFLIKVDREKLYARFPGYSEYREKRFSHIDDLYALPFNGLLKLATDFSNELEAEENPYPERAP